MDKRARIVIVGATSLIAEHCAREWLKTQRVDFVLVGRDERRLDRIKRDLNTRSPESRIEVLDSDFLEPDGIDSTVNTILESGPVDIVLIAHGFLPRQTQCEKDRHLIKKTMDINAVSPMLFADAFADEFCQRNHGTIAMIGSVAGDRGRQSNYIYGAAKGALARYAEGLAHRCASSNVKVVMIKPGPTKTPMTAGLNSKGIKLASVELVAKQSVKAIKAGQTVLYTPRRWRLIMLLIQHIPAFLFNKLKL